MLWLPLIPAAHYDNYTHHTAIWPLLLWNPIILTEIGTLFQYLYLPAYGEQLSKTFSRILTLPNPLHF